MADMTLTQIVDAIAPEVAKRVAADAANRLTPIEERLGALDAINTRLQELETGIQAQSTALDEGITELRERVNRSTSFVNDRESPFAISRIDGRTLIVPRLSDRAAVAVINLARTMVSAKDMGAFLRDLSSGTTAAGGALLHDEYVPELIALITLYGDARKYFRKVTMTQKTQTFPSLDGEGTDAQWVTEAGTPGANTEPVFGSVTLTNQILMALAGIPVSLLDDSNPDVAQIVAQHIARKFAKAEDLAGFKGTGAGIATQQPFTGVLNHADVQTLPLAAGDNFNESTASDFLGMQNAVETAAIEGAAYYVHRTVVNHLRGLKDTTGRFIYQEPSASKPATLWDFPLRTVEALPKMSDSAASTPFAIFGNLEWVMLGDRKQIAIASSEHAGWNNLKVITRGYERVAIEVAAPAGLCVLETNAT